jgi:hypothetical protein
VIKGGCSVPPRFLPQEFDGELDSDLTGRQLQLGPSHAPGSSPLKQEDAAGDEQEEGSKPKD